MKVPEIAAHAFFVSRGPPTGGDYSMLELDKDSLASQAYATQIAEAAEAEPEVTTAQSAQPTPSALSGRLVSLDVFRGLTIAGMVLVNNAGSWDAVHEPLEHAKWDG